MVAAILVTFILHIQKWMWLDIVLVIEAVNKLYIYTHTTVKVCNLCQSFG